MISKILNKRKNDYKYLSGVPLDNMSLKELAQVYCYYWFCDRKGAANTILDELEKREKKYDFAQRHYCEIKEENEALKDNFVAFYD